MLIASTKGWYGRCDQVTLAELQTVPLVLRESGSGTLEVISKYLAAADVRLASLRVVMQLGSTESIKSFVRNSDAMAIVSGTRECGGLSSETIGRLSVVCVCNVAPP